jgi:beta-glucosidase
VRNNSWTEVDYSEGLLMGYRWYDAQGTDPLFPFGHGLSYSSFEYSQLQVSPTVGPGGVLTVSCVVRNVGPFAGAEVAQLYVGYDPAADEPPKLLKDFAKFSLQAGASTTVSFELPAQALQVWLGQWTLVPGQYVALVGSSSRDIRLQAPFTVTASS